MLPSLQGPEMGQRYLIVPTEGTSGSELWDAHCAWPSVTGLPKIEVAVEKSPRSAANAAESQFP